jgi:hypothetical protein
VVAIAINSGLVTYPTAFRRAWQSGDCALWYPVPPAGYVALGCVATLGGGGGGGGGESGGGAAAAAGEPPPLKSVVVVHERAVVEALLSECMLLCANGNLWCVQNALGTFHVSAGDGHQPQASRRLFPPPPPPRMLFALLCPRRDRGRRMLRWQLHAALAAAACLLPCSPMSHIACHCMFGSRLIGH